MVNYDIIENWDISKNQFIQLLPFDKIEKYIGHTIDVKVAFDEEILNIDVMAYNMPIYTRAFNQNLSKSGLQRENLYKFFGNIIDTNFKEIFSIQLPQVLIYSNLVDNEYMIGLHIAKIRSDEFFINDMVFKKDPNTLLKKKLSPIVTERLIELGKRNGIKYISGYAVNKEVLDIFQKQGFKADLRECYGNDWLFNTSKITGAQFPFYLEIN